MVFKQSDAIRSEFDHVLETQLDALYRTAFRMLSSREDAEDAVQDTCGKALRSLDTFKPGSSMAAWVFRILSNTCIDKLRARKRAVHIPIDSEAVANRPELRQTDATPENETHRNAIMQRTKDAIDNLPDEMKPVVQLIIIEEFSYADAAQALELPIGTIRSRLSRARQRLCYALADILDASVADAGHEQSSPPLRLVK